jgi:hypothetical protein
MALTLDGTNGLFTRLGKLAGLAEAVRLHQADIKTRIAAIQAEYSSADLYMVADLAAGLEAKIAASGAILADIQSAMETTLVEMTYEDSVISSYGVLPSKNVESALLYLIREMDTVSETVDGTTISLGAATATAGNTGNGTIVVSVLPPLALDAKVTQFPNIRNERLEARCIEDAKSKWIKSGSEIFQIRGFGAFGNLDYRFPKGSGTRLDVPCLNAAAETGARYEQLARNGSFEAFTSNTPNNWTVSVGTPGTHFAQETSVFYRGASAFKFIGNGATLAKIVQKLGSETGTPYTIASDRLYILAVSARATAGISAGEVRLSLQDSNTATVVSGASVTIPYTMGATYGWKTVVFRAPLNLPAGINIALEQTTAINAGATVYLDELVLAEVRQIAPGGAGVVVLPGSTDWAVNDSLFLTLTNNAEGEWNTEFDRFFGMYERGLLLPANTAGAETILDSLIS